MTEPCEVFASAVDYYAAYRTGYPPGHLDGLVAQLGLGPTHHVLDIGCGTGQIAIPVAPHCRSVTAIDPVAEMLDRGRAAAAEAGVDSINWLEGDSRDLASLVEPGAQVAFFAASFHWTDRAHVARVLDGLLAPGGAIVVTHDVLDDASLPDWDVAIGEIRARYLGEPPAHLQAHLSPARSHREILAKSAFSDLRSEIWTWVRTLTIEEVVGLQFSYSFSSPARLGGRRDAFAREVRDTVLALHPSGVVTEPFRHEVLIAHRPGSA